MTVDPWTGLASLLLCLATGAWVGYRWALESRRFDAVIEHTLAGLDLTPEDETERHPACPCLYDDPWTRR